MQRKVSFAEREFYHLYNRGVDKRVIFIDNSDYSRFINLLFFCNGKGRVNMRHINKKLYKGITFADSLEERGETLVDIGAFCLMTNHFHLLIHEKQNGGISSFLQKLCTAYSMYFNTKYERTGKLFGRAFLSEHADSDPYLKYLFSYIHLNPAKIIDPNWKEKGTTKLKEIKGFIENYQFSSYRNYLGESLNIEILNTQPFPSYFIDKGIEEDIEDWLIFNTKATPLQEGVDNYQGLYTQQ